LYVAGSSTVGLLEHRFPHALRVDRLFFVSMTASDALAQSRGRGAQVKVHRCASKDLGLASLLLRRNGSLGQRLSWLTVWL
jgi:hypothetical protein